MYITKINGLAEKFLYFNDDVFINRPLRETDFFERRTGKPIVWVCDEYKNLYKNIDAVDCYINETNDQWCKTLLRAWKIFVRKNYKIPFITPNHSVDAYDKYMFENAINRYPELLKVNSSKIRTGNEISRLLISYEMIFNLGCKYKYRWNDTKINRILSRIGLNVPTAIIRNTPLAIEREINKRHPKTFCLNSVEMKDAAICKEFLAKKFPKRAPWES